MFDRIADPDTFIDISKERNRLAFKVNSLSQDLKASQSKAQELCLQVQELHAELERYRQAHGELPALKAPPRADG